MGKFFAECRANKSKESFGEWRTSRGLYKAAGLCRKELCRQNVYTLTLVQSRKSPGRLPSIPLVLPRQPVSRRGLSSAQFRAGPKARLDHSGDFGSSLKWRSYRSSWVARSSLQVPARHIACQNRCWSHCR